MSESEQGGAGRREVAYRIFAAEYEDANFSYSESDEERAPNYVVTPTGARINRLFVVGVLTEVEQVNDDVLRARIVDPTGAFVVYAGQYQPDEMAFLERADPPMFISVTGKARTFQPDDSDTVYTSVRPESINEVEAETRDRWTVTTAERTIDRVETMAGALAREERGDELRTALEAAGVDEGLASGTAMAIEQYGTTPSYLQALRETALDAARVVAGERDEVDSLAVSPDATGSATLSDLVDVDAIEQSESEAAMGTAETAQPTATADQSSATETETSGDSVASEQSTTASSATATTADSSTTESGESADTDAVAESTDTAATSTESETVDTDPTETDSEPVGAESDPVEAETASGGDIGADSEPSTVTTADSIGDEQSEPAGTTADEQPTSTPDAGTDADADEEDIGDFEPGEFEIEDDERERIEEEFGTDFSTGTEVDDPGEADIETPEPEPESEAEVEAETEAASESKPSSESEPEPATEAEPEPDTETAKPTDETPTEADEEPAEDVNLSEAVMDVMRDLNGDDGANRAEVISSVVDQYGAAEDDVESAIEDALMDGRCYEPNDTTLKPI